MTKTQQRDLRRLAMQVLYQIDLTAEEDAATLEADVDEGQGTPVLRHEAVKLALGAWHGRGDADAAVAELAPDWPTHRQPPVDRAILRLAHHELATGRAPGRVVLNEAVELAKIFSNEHAPAFVNGVLDKLYKRMPDRDDTPVAAPPVSADEWLEDAVVGQETKRPRDEET